MWESVIDDWYEPCWDGPEPEIREESDWLFLDEEFDDLVTEFGPAAGWDESDLMEMLDRYADRKRDWKSAEWCPRMWGIKYSYEIA